MRPYILLLLVLLGCREGTQLREVSKCGLPCYTSKGGQDIGTCRSGVWKCEGDDQSTAVCEGEVGPSREVCDGLDNNCDGVVDERLSQTCINACGSGTETCSKGAWVGCTAPQPVPEICNGKDDDCDGQIDEPENLPIEYCYDGPAGTTTFGECRPGVKRCQFGQTICYGEVTPKPEACNGKDDNCDGQVDEGLSPTSLVDVVFAIDDSGSMSGTISAVKAAVAGFAATYGNRIELRWALVTVPDHDPYYDGKVHLVLNLTDPASFNQAIQQQNAGGGGMEPSIDAVKMLASSSNPLGINWRPGSNRHLVMFTDEEPQSYATPAATASDAFATVAASNLRVHVFTTTDLFADFQALGPVGQLDVQPLTTLPQAMQSALTTLIQEATCQ